MIRSKLSQQANSRRWLFGLDKLWIWRFDQMGALIGLVFLALSFSFLSPSFRQAGNILLIAMMASTIGIVAVGQTLVLLIGGIDLSVGSVVALTGLITASLMKYGLGPIPPLSGTLSYGAIGIGLLIGAFIGAMQGRLISNRRMPPFIVTLGTLVGLRGVTQAFSYGLPTHSLPDDFKWISDGQLWIVPAPAMIMLAVFALAWYILRNTKFGRYCYAIGGNETAARLSGVNVDRHKTYVYAISGLLAGLAGMILMSYIDGAAPANGGSYELYSIAAAIVGGVSMGGGVGGVWGTLIGVLIITVIPNGLIMLNALPWWRDTITGAIILIAVYIDVERRRTRQSVSESDVSPPILTGNYMNEVLTRLTREIDLRMGSAYCRIYLADRNSGDLVPQTLPHVNDLNQIVEHQYIPGQGSIVYEAKETRHLVRVANITHHPGVVPLNSDAHSALALPLLVNTRVIGVVEVQSPVTNAFRSDETKILRGLCNSMTEMLEDAWLLESGWLLQQTRDALRHLWTDLYLGRSPLAVWALSTHDVLVEYTPVKRGEALRQLLLSTIEGLRSPPNETQNTSVQRGYSILKLTYIEEHIVDEITRELHISRRQYFYDLKGALEALTDALVRNHQATLQAQTNRQEK